MYKLHVIHCSHIKDKNYWVYETVFLFKQYEDDDEGDYDSPQKKKKKKAKKSIYDVYEPSELEKGHFTEADTVIRITDVPERFQVYSKKLYNYYTHAPIEY